MWIRSEDRAELVGQGVRLRRELAPGDAHDPIAPEGELAISRAVALEALPRGVDGVAVQLDDDALVGPEGVGLVWAEGLVHRRPRQRVSLREVEERRFEVASDDGLTLLALGLEGASEGLAPLASRVPRDQGIEGEQAPEAADLRLVEGMLELLGGYDRGEVEEGSCGVGDRDDVVDGDFVGRELAAVCLDSRAP